MCISWDRSPGPRCHLSLPPHKALAAGRAEVRVVRGWKGEWQRQCTRERPPSNPFPPERCGAGGRPLPQSGSAVRTQLSLPCPRVPAALRGWESGSVSSARRALPLPPGLRSGAGRWGLKIPGGGSGGGDSGAAGLWAREAVRPILGPLANMLTFFLVSGGSLWLFAEIVLSLLEKMQTQEILRILRLPELGDLGQFFRSLSATTLVSMGALAAVLAYWLAHRPKALQPPCNLLMQSEEVEDSGGARRSVIGGSTQLLTHYYDDARTMYQVFRRGLSISGNGPCLGFRKPKQPYQWLSYQEVANRAEFLGSGLLQHDCKVGTEQFIGVFAQNRPEWIIAELACYTYSMVVVPLYDTLGPGAIRYIINTADICTVIVDKPQKAILLLEHVEKKETPGLKLIILMEPFEDALKERGQKCGVDVKSMQAIEPPRPDDLSIVCFTSGTTGNPKGAMLTHGNVVADFSGFLKVTEKVIFPRQDDVLISFLPLAHMFERVIQSQWAPTCADVHFSYLPLAHMFERMVQSVVYCHGGRVGFFQGDIRLLSDDMKALRPTIFPVVPRLLNRMYDKIFHQADTSLKRWLLEFAAKRKQAEVRSGIIRNNSIWDDLFFNKIQVKERACQSRWAREDDCYGSSPRITSRPRIPTSSSGVPGHVGAPLPCNHIKLVDAEELNYWTSKGEGEICVKGPNVFKGYLKDGDRTKEALDSDGWLHTGDIGKWLPEGTLKIIDRKKHIFKLAQGEYVAPEKIENIYIRSEPVAQVYVHGDSLKAFLVGIVVPDPEVMPAWAQKKGIKGTFQELCKNKVKAIHIHCDMFSVQNGLLTPTLKAKRPELREYFKKQIEELYSASM
ncbi:Long-chain-fatty-acid--CoA ligase 6 [Microtus ochrogaster]|uniref:Long-chain-fatty-acid--CoA ligase n=1 Tax=Microtus ochrogaster TaxID=79684 RepID=A0A8J6KSK3_MICOH|nr:Long-chain-fatty-acid--CoA ligase 6 [Microtus ochrogaster]